jgi:hypothetical protein
MGILILKLDEIHEEIRQMEDKMLQAIDVSAAAKDKLIKFTQFIQRLQDFVTSLGKRKLFVTNASIRDKVKIWCLELNMSYQELATSICLIYDELVARDASLNYGNSHDSKSKKNFSTLTHGNLAALNQSRTGMLDVEAVVSPEAMTQYEEIIDSAAELRGCVQSNVNFITAKYPDIQDNTRNDVIVSGMIQLVAKIDSAVEELDRFHFSIYQRIQFQSDYAGIQ